MKSPADEINRPPPKIEVNPESLVRQLLEFIGDDPTRKELGDTPKRVVEELRKRFAGYTMDPLKMFGTHSTPVPAGSSEMMLTCSIPFSSTDESDMTPFFGFVHIGYTPRHVHVSWAALHGIVNAYALRLQSKARLGEEIAEAVFKFADARGVGVAVDAQMTCGGIIESNSIALRGSYKTQPKARDEFIQAVR